MRFHYTNAISKLRINACAQGRLGVRCVLIVVLRALSLVSVASGKAEVWSFCEAFEKASRWDLSAIELSVNNGRFNFISSDIVFWSLEDKTFPIKIAMSDDKSRFVILLAVGDCPSYTPVEVWVIEMVLGKPLLRGPIAISTPPIALKQADTDRGSVVDIKATNSDCTVLQVKWSTAHLQDGAIEFEYHDGQIQIPKWE